ncbi:M36 family metallopeptidase [Sphaerisporangium sp. NPDC051011]|uniref:M36 family metallopeptidase n=1 Tax=Sphaerisporangium sp. NPDC051011 TaxID=3155792 RepID=UPI0033E6759A
MSSLPPLRTIIVTAAAASLALSLAGAAQGEERSDQRHEQRKVSVVHGDDHGKPDKDNRTGRVAPPLSARKSTKATVRWNNLGTPAIVTSAEPLAEGLAADPAQAARDYLKANTGLFGLEAEAVDALETVAVNPIGTGHAVLLRQTFGGLPSGYDGLVSIGVSQGKVVYASSTLSRATEAPPAAAITEQRALEIAARDGEIDLAAASTKRVEEVAVPAADGVHRAFQVTLIEQGHEDEPAAYTTYVDAVSGEVLVRENLVDHFDPDTPAWSAFPANPPADYSSRDTRETWCATPGWRCDLVAGDAATGRAWDVDHDTNTPTNTSLGNAARTFENRASGSSNSVGTRSNVVTPSRKYDFPWQNQWFKAKCDPAAFDAPGEADLEAAISNLHAMHNRMHDWSYRLGFTEKAWNMQVSNGDRGGLGGDPERGNAQAGARVLSIRNNANQITPADGIAPITNMYLWQPQAGAFYPPCVDGDYDMSVIGHEYTHAISNRMVAGPNAGLSGAQAGAMGESISDLFSMEYLFENGYRPRGDTPYVTGGYVTGDSERGIRNYDMSKSPLNYSDIAYDLVGQQVHADGEIWSATQFDVRDAFIDRYGKGSSKDQRACAEGQKPIEKCPGNRRWIQLHFDAFLLTSAGNLSMVDMRDAMLAADRIRFGGANQDIMWKAFAEHGLGAGASSNATADPDPTPSFASPNGGNATVTLQPRGEAAGAPVRLYVGDYEGRVVPVADTDPATELGATFEIVPGEYSFVAVAPGFGHKRFEFKVKKDRPTDLPVEMSRNHASAAAGAVATGDGVNQDKLIDETESTNWASLTAPVAGRSVMVDLAGTDAVKIRRVQVSAMLRPAINDAADAGSQNRFSALRAFEVLACDATSGADCANPANYNKIYTSRKDAFATSLPRPRGGDLIIKSFDVPKTLATHLILRTVSSQCTGNPLYLGEQDDDPNSSTDCATASPFAGQIRAAEFQAFSH